MFLNEEQWEALRDYIQAEAQYQAQEPFNRNDCVEVLRRSRYEKRAEEALKRSI